MYTLRPFYIEFKKENKISIIISIKHLIVLYGNNVYKCTPQPIV